MKGKSRLINYSPTPLIEIERVKNHDLKIGLVVNSFFQDFLRSSTSAKQALTIRHRGRAVRARELVVPRNTQAL
jgi:hypothetical protein